MKKTIICIGHGTSKDGGISPPDRLQVDKAIELIRNDGIKNIILCGGNNYKNSPKEAELMAAKIESKELGINIFIEKASKDTIESVAFAKKIVDKAGFDKIIFICWKHHITRAYFVFKRVFNNIEIKLISTEGDLGDNSQKRLNSRFSLLFWETAAWIYTFIYFYILRR